jgi:hypothetical protein
LEKKDKAGSKKQPRREAVCQPEFIEDLRHGVATERRVALRALVIVEAVPRDPFIGIGKPEPLNLSFDVVSSAKGPAAGSVRKL